MFEKFEKLNSGIKRQFRPVPELKKFARYRPVPVPEPIP